MGLGGSWDVGRQGGGGELPQKDQVGWVVIVGAVQTLLVSHVLHWVFASHRGDLGVCGEAPVLPTSHALTRLEHLAGITIPLCPS